MVEGPPFLKMFEQHWLKQEEIRSTDLTLTELTKTPHQETHVPAVISEHTISLMKVIDGEKFSNFKFLLRVTARVLRFLAKIWGRPLRFYHPHYSSNELEADELNRAEML